MSWIFKSMSAATANPANVRAANTMAHTETLNRKKCDKNTHAPTHLLFENHGITVFKSLGIRYIKSG